MQIVSESIREVINSDEAAQIVEDLASVPSGREDKVLSESPFVERLVLSMAAAGDVSGEIETQLDELFEDLQPKHEFDHTELVMVLMFAMKRAKIPYLMEVVGVLNSFRAPEISRLRRFASKLC